MDLVASISEPQLGEAVGWCVCLWGAECSGLPVLPYTHHHSRASIIPGCVAEDSPSWTENALFCLR